MCLQSLNINNIIQSIRFMLCVNITGFYKKGMNISQYFLNFILIAIYFVEIVQTFHIKLWRVNFIHFSKCRFLCWKKWGFIWKFSFFHTRISFLNSMLQVCHLIETGQSISRIYSDRFSFFFTIWWPWKGPLV